jgi:hypothetical protein
MMELFWKPFHLAWGVADRNPWISVFVTGLLTVVAAIFRYDWITLILGSICGTILMFEAEKTAPGKT